MESYCYNLIKFVIEYILHSDKDLSMKQSKVTESKKIILYMYKLKEYFEDNMNENLKKLLNKLDKAKNSKSGDLSYFLEDSEEGVFDDDSSENGCDNEPTIKIARRSNGK